MLEMLSMVCWKSLVNYLVSWTIFHFIQLVAKSVVYVFGLNETRWSTFLLSKFQTTCMLVVILYTIPHLCAVSDSYRTAVGNAPLKRKLCKLFFMSVVKLKMERFQFKYVSVPLLKTRWYYTLYCKFVSGECFNMQQLQTSTFADAQIIHILD